MPIKITTRSTQKVGLSILTTHAPLPYNTLVFSGGEVQVKLDVKYILNLDNIEIEAYLTDSKEVMELLMLTDALRRAYPEVPIELSMPYIPYARQDRVCAPGEALSLKVFCTLINSQNYSRVNVCDPHSEVSTFGLDRVRVVHQAEFVKHIFGGAGLGYTTVLVAPDAGAMKKVSEVAKAAGTRYIRADKTRDVNTGVITGTEVYPLNPADGNETYLIVDDIIDGGRTFTELAKKLREITTGDLYLYATHGIFSAGLAELKKHFKNVYCAYSFIGFDDSFLKQVRIY